MAIGAPVRRRAAENPGQTQTPGLSRFSAANRGRPPVSAAQPRTAEGKSRKTKPLDPRLRGDDIIARGWRRSARLRGAPPRPHQHWHAGSEHRNAHHRADRARVEAHRVVEARVQHVGARRCKEQRRYGIKRNPVMVLLIRCPIAILALLTIYCSTRT